MRALDAAADWLRHLVDTRTWDYCVVWRLGDDPSRFIEWMDCCCSGGIQVKDEPEELVLSPKCRDSSRHHSVRTKACEALSHFPSAVPLYAGIHGEVVISNQARWFYHNHGTSSASTPHEFFGTQVVIPVHGGLLEFFSSKQIHEDHNLVKLVMAQFNGCLEPQAISSQSYVNFGLSQQYSETTLESSQNLPQNLPCPLLPPSLVPKYNIHPGLDELSNGCAAPIGTPVTSASAYNYPSENSLQLIGNYCTRIRSGESVSNQGAGYALKGKRKGARHDPGNTQLQGKKGSKAKNLIPERNRRNRIKHGFFALRALVPKITKMDKVSTLTDAIDYIVELEKERNRLQDELKNNGDEECKRSNVGSEITRLDGEQDSKSSSEQNQNLCSIGTGFGKETRVCIEVNQICKSKFLIEFFCEHGRGGFVRLMQAVDSLGLEVVNANVTTFEGKVQNILIVEANKNEISPRRIQDSLIQLAK